MTNIIEDNITFEKIADEISTLTVMHTQFNLAYEGICKIAETSQKSGVPFGGVVIAPPGSGKSHLIKNIERRYRQNANLFSSKTAVLSISAAAAPNSGSMIDRMLQQLGHPPGIRTTRQQDLRLTILLKGIIDKKVQIIIIDEFQHIFRGKRNTSANEITDLLKEVMDKTKIPIFVFGTDELGDLNQLDIQFASRLPARYHIPEFARNENWIGFLNAFNNACKNFDLSILPAIESQLHNATSGSPRTLKFLVISAIRSAIEKKMTKVDIDCFCNAHENVFGPTNKNNPFIK
jgi:archaellum biogenesis ATPase FlaH